MFPLIKMTTEQIGGYRLIWGEFTQFAYIFSGFHRVFAFYGTLDVSKEGQIALQDLLVACSCKHEAHELVQEIQKLNADITNGEWQIVSRDAHHIEGIGEEFQLTLSSEATQGAQERMVATHLLLSYPVEETNRHREIHLQHYFPLCSGYVKQSGQPLSHFYPVGTNYAPEKSESLTVQELAYRLREKPVVAFTGAGISLKSGIPTFVGSGGLAKHFPLLERFPGTVTDRMIKRPHELARLLGHFQSCFITAQPNAAHFALAEMEKRGNLIHLITGNGDRLHERAGSQRVHLKEPHYFVDSEEGWRWIREGKIFLVVGVSRDEHGFLSYARDQGLQVVVIAPERPSFLYAKDWFVQGCGEEVLPELVTRLRLFRSFN